MARAKLLPDGRLWLECPGCDMSHVVVDGVWQYLGDCTHALAGTHVDLPEIE